VSRRRTAVKPVPARRGTRRASPPHPSPDSRAKSAGTGSPRTRDRPGAHRLTKVLLSFGLTVTTLTLGGQWALHQSIFRVQHVTLLGARHESPARVLAASGLTRHPTMLGLSAGSIKENLTSFPWIVGVSLEKRWPNTVVVTVHETLPVAVAFNAKHVLQYVNAAGRDLGVAPLHSNYPTLTYLHPRNASWPYDRAGRSAALVAGELLLKAKAFNTQVSVISVDAAGEVTLQMTTPVEFFLGPATDLTAKFVAIASVIAHTTLRPGDVVDVRVPDELAVTGPAPS